MDTRKLILVFCLLNIGFAQSQVIQVNDDDRNFLINNDSFFNPNDTEYYVKYYFVDFKKHFGDKYKIVKMKSFSQKGICYKKKKMILYSYIENKNIDSCRILNFSFSINGVDSFKICGYNCTSLTRFTDVIRNEILEKYIKYKNSNASYSSILLMVNGIGMTLNFSLRSGGLKDVFVSF
jgi:hypothetical protein